MVRSQWSATGAWKSRVGRTKTELVLKEWERMQSVPDSRLEDGWQVVRTSMIPPM